MPNINTLNNLANTKEEAKAIIHPLPFVRNAVASYKLDPVGVFWMGTKQ